MKKLLVIAVVLSTLFLGGCVGIPSAHMSGSIGFGGMPNGGYGVRYGEATRAGDGVSVPVYSPYRGYMYMGDGYIENRCKYKNEATRWMKRCR